ncbi:MAG: GxxExxY protein [candidate division WOR-3 bacterium]
MGKVEEVIKEAAVEVHSILGSGYQEGVYELALAHELRLRKIKYERQKFFDVVYKGYYVGQARTDIIVNPKSAGVKEEEILLELKKGKTIDDSHIKQAQVYLVSLNILKGLVLAFGGEEIKIPDTMQSVQKPDLKLMTDEVLSLIKGKEKTPDLKLLTKITDEVYDYFGSYFLNIGDGVQYYAKAIGVELTLRGIKYHAITGNIFYKKCVVAEHSYDIMLEDGTVLCVQQYSHKKKETVEDVINNAIEDEKKFFKLLGIKKGYYIGIPAEEGERPVVKEM